MKRRFMGVILALAMVMGAGCQAAEQKETELMVYAAASLTETLTELGKTYEEEHEGTKVLFNFDSSGTLKTQLEEGAKADVFISAAQKQMNEMDGSLDSEKNPAGLDLIATGTRLDLLENKVVLAVPEGNPAAVQSFEDMAKGLENGDLFMVMGNSDVPVGQYTSDILKFFNLDEAALAKQGHITYGSNVKEVTTQISEGMVDCGVIYSTDATAAGLEAVDEADETMVGRVVYPAAALKGSSDPAFAKAFLEFLQSEVARNVFSKAGFTPLP